MQFLIAKRLKYCKNNALTKLNYGKFQHLGSPISALFLR